MRQKFFCCRFFSTPDFARLSNYLPDSILFSDRDMFQTEYFDPSWICQELYHPAKLGGISIQGFLPSEFKEELLCEIKNNSRLFRRAPRKYINAFQEFDYFHLGEADQKRVKGDFKAMYRLREGYADLCSALSKRAQFSTAGHPNSITVQRYWERSLGITPHRDESKYINLISIFILEGEAPFFVCSDRQKSQCTQLPALPEDLILLRTPRNPEEKRLRPIHCVGRVTQERYSVTFRQIE
ncbi:hypothetical protein MYX78_12185 [Acidobacteria bacterium AH-259-G07]|nr:hypothetical protein [Acidobacteria bacterium AH-259-G07]